METKANIPQQMKLLRRKRASTDRPYLLDFLARLGIPKAKTANWIIGKCYNEIFRRIRIELNKPDRAHVGNYYKLWANGIALDHLRSMTRHQAHQMITMIEAAKPH
jgi:hypothetical protein